MQNEVRDENTKIRKRVESYIRCRRKDSCGLTQNLARSSSSEVATLILSC